MLLGDLAGCSSVRLEYSSGGRVVAGSNPVIPTSHIEKFIVVGSVGGNSPTLLFFYFPLR